MNCPSKSWSGFAANDLGTLSNEDGEEALELIEASGGIAQLRFAFYRQEDLGNDRIWDVCDRRPSTVIHFRGAPHVHVTSRQATTS